MTSTEQRRVELPKWPNTLWDELQLQAPKDQFVTAGDWIVFITSILLPELGIQRRKSLVKLVDAPGATAASVAVELGMRASTVTRLVEEARSYEKHKRKPEPVEDLPAAA